MSESTPIAAEALSEAETKEAFERLGAVKPCPACGHGRWVMMVDAHDYSAIPLIPHGRALPRDHMRHIPLTVMICENCAFIRPHATAILRAKLAEARAKGKSHSDE